jgi:hypothetical protein
VQRASDKRARAIKRAEKGETLRPIEETTANPDEGEPASDDFKLSAELEQD